MKKNAVLLLPVLIVAGLICISPVFAQTTPTPSPNSAIIDAELERERTLTKALSLNLPDQTEDPMYPITFVDPSPTKEGVDITVDDKTTAKAPNPFLLPNLSIGSHKIIFKFKDSTGVKVLSKTLLVVPKAPLFDQSIKTQVIRPASVSLAGTALPQSTVFLVVNGLSTFKVSTSPDGKWEFIIPEPQEGNNTVLAFTIRNGIMSAASKPLTISYQLSEDATSPTETGTNQVDSIKSFFTGIIGNIDANRREKPTIFYGSIAVAVGLILALVIISLRKRAAQKRDDKTIAALFGTLQKDGGTIIDVIKKDTQSGEEAVTTKVVPPKLKKALEELKEEIEDSPDDEPAVVDTKPTLPTEPVISLTKKVEEKPVIEVVSLDTAPKEETKPAPQPVKSAAKNKKKSTAEPVKSVEQSKAQPAENSEPVEPEKKVLSKEEFLKQFQKRAEQDAE